MNSRVAEVNEILWMRADRYHSQFGNQDSPEQQGVLHDHGKQCHRLGHVHGYCSGDDQGKCHPGVYVAEKYRLSRFFRQISCKIVRFHKLIL